MTSEESECAVIAALFNIPQWMNRHREQITAGLFSHDGRRAVVAAALADQAAGETPDIWAVTNRLGHASGNAALLMELAAPSRVPTSNDAQRHLAAVRIAYERRELANAHRLASEALLNEPLFPSEGEPDIQAVVADIMAAVGTLPGKLLTRRHIKDIIPTVFDEITDRAQNPGKLPGISTGIGSLDRVTNGQMPGQTWVFAGLPGDGKSTLMQNCAEAPAFAGHVVDWYNLEMPDEETAFRLLSSASGVDNEKLYNGLMERYEQQALSEATKRLKASPINIVDVTSATAQDILNDIERSSSRIAVVDYLQLLEPGDIRKGASREEVIAGISRKLKRAAKLSGKTILTGSQLNDSGKLRESRAIGQDADKVLLINKHPLEGGKEGETDDSKRMLFGAKNRGGKRHWNLPLRFLGHVFQFREEIM